MKEFLLVSIGSFFGGGARFLVSRLVQSLTVSAFPLGTLAVNVLGCLLIGWLSALPWPGGWLSPQTRLLLTTGFCGGFTTFSTFMNESAGLIREGHWLLVGLYLVASLALGFAAVILGQRLA